MEFQGGEEYGLINEIEADFLSEKENNDGAHLIPIIDEVIFLVHLTRDLLQEQDSGNGSQEIPLKVILNGFISFVKSKIISRSSDKVGLILFNSIKTNNDMNFAGVDVISFLGYPSADMIQRTNELIQTLPRISQTVCPLHEALWICSHIFKQSEKGPVSNSGAMPTSQRIFLFTAECEPPVPADRDLETAISQAMVYVQQLATANVEIELFPIRVAGKIFDYTKFYGDIVTVDPDEANEQVLNPSSKLSDLAVRIRRREFKKRRLGRVDFRIGEGVIVGTQFYALINQVKLPSSINLNAENNKPVKITTKYVCQETGAELYEKDIGFYIPLKEKRVEFTREEMDRIKSFGEPSLVLIGFKPRSSLKVHHNVKPPYFLYPDDERVENSGKFFDGLIKSMTKPGNEKVAICRFVPRNKSRVRFVALLPQAESYDEDSNQTPAGLNLVFLPFADEIKDTDGKLISNKSPESEDISATDPTRTQIAAAKRLINGLTTNFSPFNFENPNLQKNYSYLQALALGEQEPEPVVDYLQPDSEGMQAVSGLALAFRHEVWGEDYIDPEERQKIEAARKQQRGGKQRVDRDSDSESAPQKTLKVGDKSVPAKNPKPTKMDEETATAPSDEERLKTIAEKLKDGYGGDLRVEDLRFYIEKKGGSTKGKKGDLLQEALRLLEK